MRLAVVTREYPSITSSHGGLGSRLAVLAPELARLGHEVHVLVPAGDHDRDEEHEGVRFHLIRGHGHRRLFAEARWGLVADDRLRRLGSLGVVLAPNWGGDAWRYARRKRRQPVITNLTTSLEQILLLSGSERRASVYQALQKQLERAQTERSDALIAVSRSVLRWSEQLWDIDRIPATVLPNPVDVDRVRRLGGGTPPPTFPNTGPVVAFSGALVQRKGVDVLVKAMREVWKSIPDAQLVLAGRDDGAISDYLRALAGPFAKRVHLLGHLEPEPLLSALAAADVVTCPSLWEASSNAALEAMALGCTLVLTSGSGFDEYCTHLRDGLLVPPGDPAALGTALGDLLDDPDLRARLGSSAANRVMAEHGAPVATAKYAEFFKAVALKQRARGSGCAKASD